MIPQVTTQLLSMHFTHNYLHTKCTMSITMVNGYKPLKVVLQTRPVSVAAECLAPPCSSECVSESYLHCKNTHVYKHSQRAHIIIATVVSRHILIQKLTNLRAQSCAHNDSARFTRSNVGTLQHNLPPDQERKRGASKITSHNQIALITPYILAQ